MHFDIPPRLSRDSPISSLTPTTTMLGEARDVVPWEAREEEMEFFL